MTMISTAQAAGPLRGKFSLEDADGPSSLDGTAIYRWRASALVVSAGLMAASPVQRSTARSI
jgi:hypothetical protein